MNVGLLLLVASVLLSLGIPLGATAQDLDMDGDTVADAVDNCPTIANAGQTNGDGDAAGDACDNCVAVAQTGTVSDVTDGTAQFCDGDSDGYGNLCDADFGNDLSVGLPDIDEFQVPGLNQTVPPGNPTLDSNCDGLIGIPDITGFSRPQQNSPPGPSGLSCAGSRSCAP